MEGWKTYFGIENNYKEWEENEILLETLVTTIILYGCEVWDCGSSR